MSSTPPTTLGKYQIIREIARSNDIVYEAYDPLMNRRVALKELAIPQGSTPQQTEERVRRFVREAKAAGSLNHPGIVTIFECGEEGGRFFIAMEFLEGHTLRNEIDTRGFLPTDEAIKIARQMLEALDFAHKNGVVHRDIKPENIQLMPGGRVKLTDFGIARLTFEPNLTMDGQVFGTPSYMSPEQVVGKEIDARSDLFSVGVVLYEMLGGTKPFAGDSVVAITYAIMNSHPAQPAQCNHALWQVIGTALDKSPALRYASANEMLMALEAAETASRSVVLDPIPPPQAVSYAAYGSQGVVPPPVGNPYVNSPYGAPPAAPPAYHYNPYTPPNPYQQTVQNNPGYHPYTPVPVYYPPPPRPPLVTPETKAFLVRLFTVVLVLGLIFAIVIFAVQGISQAMNQQQVRQRPPVVSGNPQRSAGNGTWSPPPYRGEAPVPESASPRGGTLPPVEARASSAPPSEEAAQLAAMAREIASVAGLSQDAEVQQAMLTDAARLYERSLAAATPGAQHDAIAAAASRVYFSLAQNASSRAEAREHLYRARELAGTVAPDVSQAADRALESLTR